ncbi:MAG TPA: hypothetical protein VF329_03865 [Gammaproteobacteria bacterium]
MGAPSDAIPVLTDVVPEPGGAERASYPTADDVLVAELQTKLAAEAFALTDEVIRKALAELEASLLEQVSLRLREALPELIDTILRDHLTSGDDMDMKERGSTGSG